VPECFYYRCQVQLLTTTVTSGMVLSGFQIREGRQALRERFANKNVRANRSIICTLKLCSENTETV